MISRKIRPMIIFSEFFGEKMPWEIGKALVNNIPIRCHLCDQLLTVAHIQHSYCSNIVVNNLDKLYQKFSSINTFAGYYTGIGSKIYINIRIGSGSPSTKYCSSYSGSERWIVWFNASVAQIQRTDLICICTLHASLIDVIQNPIAFPTLFNFQ